MHEVDALTRTSICLDIFSHEMKQAALDQNLPLRSNYPMSMSGPFGPNVPFPVLVMTLTTESGFRVAPEQPATSPFEPRACHSGTLRFTPTLFFEGVIQARS